MKKCIIIGAGINITPARLALINSDVNDGDYVILVGSNGGGGSRLIGGIMGMGEDISNRLMTPIEELRN